MSNFTQANTKRIQYKINRKDYFDFQVNQDNTGTSSFSGYPFLDEDYLSCYIDVTNPDCVSGDWLTSLSSYTWASAFSNGLDLQNIGFTGIDNGLIQYRRDRITNKEFYQIFTGSEYKLDSSDLRLHLHPVSGTTKQYVYPIDTNEDGSKRLSGGFYQGFFRSKCDYSILPSTMGSEWNMEFILKKEDYEIRNTLDNKYPENKGIFFYIGTRAENKWYEFYKDDTIYPPCEEDDEIFDDDLIEEELDLSTVTLQTDNGFDLNSANDEYTLTDNKFLMFDRTHTGLTVANYNGNEETLLAYKSKKSTKNLFLYLNHTPSGYTVNNINNVTEEEENTYSSFYSDLYSNALAFFIDDEGCIGYRYLVKDCSGDSEGYFSILEGKSLPSMIKTSEWAKINVKIKPSEDYMKIHFYVNGKLKYVTKELPKLNLKDLDELDEKEEGVAYNISLGGGTQGLAEMILPNYMDDPQYVYPLERYFGGSFIGDFKSFKFYTN